MRRAPLAALLLVAPAAPATAFEATLTRVSPVRAVPTAPVSSAGLPPLPGTVVSTRGPMVAMPETAPGGRTSAVPVPTANPMRVEFCLAGPPTRH